MPTFNAKNIFDAVIYSLIESQATRYGSGWIFFIQAAHFMLLTSAFHDLMLKESMKRENKASLMFNLTNRFLSSQFTRTKTSSLSGQQVV